MTFDMSIGANSASITYLGRDHTHYMNNDHTVYSIKPKFQFKGLLSQNFHTNWEGHSYIWSKKTATLTHIHFAPDKGGIFTKAKFKLDYFV